MENKIEELEKYAYLDESEWSSAAVALCNLWHNRAYLSYDLQIALDTEITNYLDNVKANAKIISEEVTHTYTTEYLEWN